MEDFYGKQIKHEVEIYKGIYYMGADDDPIKPPEWFTTEVGKYSNESIQTAFGKIISDSKENGIYCKVVGWERLRSNWKSTIRYFESIWVMNLPQT